MQLRKRGFTLLELIIVIIVIGILASVALPRYIRIAEKGRAGEAKQMLGAIRSAQMRYAVQWGTYTGNLSRLDINFPAVKYFNFTALNASTNLSNESMAVAEANRTTLDNPGVGNYILNITMGGNLSGDATGQTMI